MTSSTSQVVVVKRDANVAKGICGSSTNSLIQLIEMIILIGSSLKACKLLGESQIRGVKMPDVIDPVTHHDEPVQP